MQSPRCPDEVHSLPAEGTWEKACMIAITGRDAWLRGFQADEDTDTRRSGFGPEFDQPVGHARV